MRLIDKTEKYSMGDEKLVGRKKNYVVEIHYSAKKPLQNNSYWWFSLYKEETDYVYNSLHDGLRYETQEECVAACETKINELTK